MNIFVANLNSIIMKTNRIYLLTLSVLLVLFSCSKEEKMLTFENGSKLKSFSAGSPEIICGEESVYDLIAGKNSISGSVKVANDKENLYVTYVTKGGWLLKETHLYVGSLAGLPLNPHSVPVPGKFTYHDSFHPFISEITYTIPLSLLSSNCFIVAAHAVVVKGDKEETAWSSGKSFKDLFGISRWGFISEYCKQECCLFNPIAAPLEREGVIEGSAAHNGVVGYLNVIKDEASQQFVLNFKLNENIKFKSFEYNKDTTGYWGFYDLSVKIYDTEDQLILENIIWLGVVQ